MSEPRDVFHGWEQASVGCYWYRPLPDGRKVTLSTWICGDESGYALTLNYETTKFPGVDAALAAYDVLARSAPGTTLDDVAAADGSQGSGSHHG